MSVLLETSEGNIVIDLFHQSQPLLSFNFLKLCQINYYNFCPFYELIKNLTITCGDSDYPYGAGGAAINNFVDVKSYYPSIERGKYLTIKTRETYDDFIGIVSFLAKKTASDEFEVGSQFTINLADAPKVVGSRIPFGKVVEGFTVLEQINISSVDDESRFLKDIRIKHAHILHDPFDKVTYTNLNPTGLPTELQLKSLRLPQLIKNDGEDEETYQALTLELIGDLPYYKMKPSPSTLFFARLNPITSEDSLSVFFSKFGEVLDCNIVKKVRGDKKTTNYGFVKFKTKEEAEKAYAKLHDGCIIDGHDVYVDFSQSVKHSKHFTRTPYKIN
ncbi:uncharacterized protein PRCAT00006025001 [Priceomyces carsonii]|uniref:uncharacterized protein n=1 Tax=Priceomyces carsonii TaxID=28549 RepID=UPI002EDB8079|nr:unnamed protein product [Priceomyces carsonii]